MERLRLKENFDRLNFVLHKEKEMADFRRWIPALAMLVLILGYVAPASAQYSISCTASAAVTPNLRHEGLDELTGDIVLSCSPVSGSHSVPVDTPVPQANVTVNLSAPWTSRILSSNVSEALLLVDNPAPGNQNVCKYPNNPAVQCLDTGTAGASYATNGQFNVFEGITTPGQPNVVTFLGVPVDPPASNATRIYRITNVRVNATGVANLAPVYGFVSSSSSTSMAISNPQQYIGVVTNGLTTSLTSAAFLQCQSVGSASNPFAPYDFASITFKELFATAFKVSGATGQTTPGVVYNTESGLEIPEYNNGAAIGTSGAANTGTRLQLAISNIPAGVTLYTDNWTESTASVTYPCVPAACTLLSDATLATGSGTPADPLVNTVTQVSGTPATSASSATVVWEVTNTNSSAIDSLTFNIYIVYTGTPAGPGTPGSPAAGATTAVPSFSPLEASWANGPVPEFSTTVNVPTAANLFTVSLCQTVLLFPYVTDFYGFDTGLAISNTSMDPVGTTTQTGTCAVNFYGTNASNLGTSGVYSSTSDTALTNGLVAPGTTWAFSMSTIDPGYNSTPTYGTTGYAIAICNFQFAHGYSFVSDTGIRQFAAAYLALIIPDEPRLPEPFSWNTAVAQPGEQLVH